MIDNADKLFDLPDKLIVDIDVHLQKKRNNMFLTPKPQVLVLYHKLFKILNDMKMEIQLQKNVIGVQISFHSLQLNN